MSSIRKGLGQALLELGQTDERVVVLSADLTDSMRVSEFKKTFPQRFIDVGVAEQNLAGVAAGLALTGKIPFIVSFAVFSPGFNWSMIRTICYSNLPVKIIGGHAGLATGQDGATHQALEDLSLMRVMPKMTVLAPADENEAKEIITAAYQHSGPVYIRSTRIDTPDLTSLKKEKFAIGRGQVLKIGNDVALIAYGSMVARALEAANQLQAQNINTRVINMSSLKPLDKQLIIQAFSQTHAVVSIEDHQKAGGLGSAIAELISQTSNQTPFKIIGVDDQFGQSGQTEELYQKYGLTADNIAQTIRNLLGH